MVNKLTIHNKTNKNRKLYIMNFAKYAQMKKGPVFLTHSVHIMNVIGKTKNVSQLYINTSLATVQVKFTITITTGKRKWQEATHTEWASDMMHDSAESFVISRRFRRIRLHHWRYIVTLSTHKNWQPRCINRRDTWK